MHGNERGCQQDPHRKQYIPAPSRWGGGGGGDIEVSSIDELNPSQQFFSHVWMISCLPGKHWIKFHAQEHDTKIPVSLKLATFRSPV